jgi:tetratricopeptide (TPR) repeat protein
MKSWQGEKIATKVLMAALFVGVVFCSFDLAVFAEMTAPQKDPALTALQQTAKTYRNNNQYDQARQVYSDIIAGFPNSHEAVFAQKNVAALYVEEGNDTAASAAVDELIADYKNHQDFAGAMSLMANFYNSKKNSQKAIELHQYVIDNCPDNVGRARACTGLALISIDSKNYVAADMAANELLTGFSSYDASENIWQIAKGYYFADNFAKARQLYQSGLRTWPGFNQAVRCNAGIMLSSFELEDFAGATAAADQLVAKMSESNEIGSVLTASVPGHTKIPSALCVLANRYVKQNDYQKAGQFYRAVIDNWPESPGRARACTGIAIMSINNNDDAVADAAVNELLTGFNNFDVSEDLHRIANKYCKERKFAKASQLYQSGLTARPGSAFADSAQINIEKMNIFSLLSNSNYKDAKIAIEKLVSDFSSDSALPSTIKDLTKKHKMLRGMPWMEDIFQQIASNHSTDAFAAKAGIEAKKLALFELISSRSGSVAIDSAINDLISTYSNNKDLAEALTEIADRCANYGDTRRAKVIHDRILQIDFEQSQNASLKIERYSVDSLIEIGETQEARIAIDQLCQSYSQDKHLPKLLESFARKFEEKGNYSACRAIYQKIVDDYPDSPGSIWPRMAIDVLDAELAGSDPNTAILAVEAKLNTYSGHPYLPRALFWSGEYYYKNAYKKKNEGNKALAKKYSQNALRLLEQVKQFADPSPPWVAPETRLFMAECYRRLGDHQKAIDSYQELFTGWPNNEYAWHAQFSIGECNRELIASGKILEVDGKAAMKIAYESLLENYSDCSVAGVASSRLNQLNSTEGGM